MAHEMSMGVDTLGRGADLVEAARSDFDRVSAQLDQEIGHLRGSWQGAGGQAFFALHEGWTDKQRVIVSALDGLATALRSTRRDVLDTDEAQATAYHHDLSRLGG